MAKLLTGTRYLIIVPIIGLALASGIFFVIGGFNLIKVIIIAVLELAGLMEVPHRSELPITIEVIEYVHTFLIGTVLYITAVGFYQLFIQEIQFPGWLRIDSTEELETNLIGVTVVVLAVNFMSIVFTSDPDTILEYGVGIALPIAALALFVGLRAWSAKLVKESETEDERESLDHASSEN